MKKIREKMELGLLKAQMGLQNIMRKEDGDTNFISIAIILAIIITVAILFISFKNTVTNWFNTAVENLKGAMGG